MAPMSTKRSHAAPTLAEAAEFTPQQVVDRMSAQAMRIDHLIRQVEWFKRQIFGQKSERRLPPPPAEQMSLGEIFVTLPVKDPQPKTMAAHTRAGARMQADDDETLTTFFDADQVPMQIIEVPNPDAAGLSPDQYEVISHKESYRLAQQPGSEAHFDVAQRFAPSQLRKGHHAEQIGAAQDADTGIPVVAIDDAAESLPWNKLHDLRKQRLAHVHAALPTTQTREHRKLLARNSNRGHP